MTRLFVDNLTVLDFSYLHPNRGVVGESWIVDVELEGELNDEGMLFDFGHVKKLLKQALDSGMDHTLVVPLALPGLSLVEEADGERLNIQYRAADGQLKFRYQAPREAVFQLDSSSVSIEAARPALEAHLNTLVPANVRKVHLHLHTEQIDGAFYHYAHGLKKHQGDCQRLCHGHRSRLEIWRDGQRDTEVERDWAQRFADIYLVTAEDQLESTEANLTHVGYDAEQGRFDVWLSSQQCYALHSDTTVELIATHLAAELGREQPNSYWRVKAFEGVRKGAIAEHRP